MPTSPRDLTGGTGRYQPTAQFSSLRADEGHRPLRAWIAGTVHRTPSFVYRCPLHTRPGFAGPPSESTEGPSPGLGWARSTFSDGEGFLRRGHSLTFPWGKVLTSGGRGAVPSRFCVSPHTRQGYALPPSPRRGFFSTPVPSRPCHPLVRRGLFLTRPGLWPCHPLLTRGFFPKILYFHQKQKNCFDKRIERTYNKYNGTEWG